MLAYEQCNKLNIVVHRSYLYFFLVETAIKVNTASAYSKLLSYIRFGTLFVSQHFSVLEIHRFPGVLKFLIQKDLHKPYHLA